MDNRRIDIRSEGRKDFDLAMELIFGKRSATHYREDKEKGLIFYWHFYPAYQYTSESPAPIPLVTEMTGNQAAETAWQWLSKRSDKDYKEYLDHDGSNGHGWRVYNGSWGGVDGEYASICAIQPIWAWYGK